MEESENKDGINSEINSDWMTENKKSVIFHKRGLKIKIDTELLTVTKNLKEEESVAKFVNFYEEKTEEKFKQIIGYLATPIDCRFSMVRYQSLPISNFVADLVRIFMNTDCVIINSGTLRIDSIINEGEFTFGMLKRLLPGEYTLVRVKATGEQIWKFLENGVSKFPALEGRFPIVS